MPGYQPHKMIEVEVNEMTLQRIAPTKPSSLRCKLGFHEMRRFELTDEQAQPFVDYSYRGLLLPQYCERCNHFSPGRRIPPKPASSRFSPPPMPPVKPAKEEPTSYVKPRQTRAEEVLGLEINKLIDLQKVISSGDLEAIRFYVGDIKALRSMHDHPMNFMRNREILTDEEREVLASVMEDQTKPNPPERPSGIRNVKDGVDK